MKRPTFSSTSDQCFFPIKMYVHCYLDENGTINLIPVFFTQFFLPLSRSLKLLDIWAVMHDFQQCGISKRVDSDEPVQPLF